MRQLLARIDDALHARLKARAEAEGRSMNRLVIELLRRGLGEHDAREALRERLRGDGRLVEPRARRVPSREEALEATRGAGTAASDALAAEREGR